MLFWLFQTKYIRLQVIRTCTYSNNLVIQSEMAFYLDLLTQLRQKHSWLFDFQLFELSVIRSNFYSLLGQFRLKSPSVIQIFPLGDCRVRTLIFWDRKTFFPQKISFQFSWLFTLSKKFSQSLCVPCVYYVQMNHNVTNTSEKATLLRLSWRSGGKRSFSVFPTPGYSK